MRRLVGCSSHSAERQPYPRIQLPCRGCARTRSSASARPVTPSSFTSRCESDQVGKWTCESVKPGRTQRPPRSTTSGPGSASSCVPTPPATCAPAIASARVVGSVGSIVRMTPFSRIMRGDCSDGRRRDDRPRRRSNVTDLENGEGVLHRSARTAWLLGRTSRRMGWSTSPTPQRWISASARRDPSGGTHVGVHVPRCGHGRRVLRRRARRGWRRQRRAGLRPEYGANYYAAYVLDPDGNNIEAVCHEGVTSDLDFDDALGAADRRAARDPRARPHARARADRTARRGDRRVARVPVGRRRALPRARHLRALLR